MATDYLHTAWALLVRPIRAAPGLSHPDRWGRAIRWALLHVLISAFGGALLSHNQYFLRFAANLFGEPPSWHPSDYLTAPPPSVRVLSWYVQSVFAWTVALGSIPALGMLLSAIIPGRHGAAKLGGIKLSLYLTVLFPAVLSLGWAYRLWFHPFLTQLFGFGGVKLPTVLPSPLTKVSLLACFFGVFWAFGLAANPYNRRRGWRPFVTIMLVFVSMWIALTHGLFPTGRLADWL